MNVKLFTMVALSMHPFIQAQVIENHWHDALSIYNSNSNQQLDSVWKDNLSSALKLEFDHELNSVYLI